MPSNYSDSAFVRQQFQTTINLAARIDLHARFSQNKYGWFPWVFDQFNLHSKSQILELGCGSGDLWWENRDRISSGWQLTLTDLFLDMVEKTKEQFLKIPQPLSREYLAVDAQAIPFETASFDAVIALHVLLFVPDREAAFKEIKRVLKPKGRFFASLLGQKNLQELWELIDKFDAQIECWLKGRRTMIHTLETEAEELSKWFSDVKLHRYEDALLVTDAEPLIGYVRSMADKAVFKSERFAEFSEFVREELAAQGAIRITKDYGVLEAFR
ncbi:MAG: class I SAM-dependent methyltransferase [Candidatus Hodarchaeota archaeon]